VFLSTDGVNFGTAVATGAPTVNPVVVTFPTQTARYIRVVQTSNTPGSWWSIYEFNVYASGNLARTGWTATASSTSGADVPANALDGALGTRWSSGVTQANGQWFLVDMQSNQTFKQLTLDANGTTDYPHGYQVFVSTDGVNFGSAVATGAPTASLVTITFPTQTARYIKIVQTGTATSWWSIYELNVD
jgi:beta-glucosidase